MREGVLQRTVIIVEDDGAVRDSLQEMLRLFGFDTLTFETGERALRAADSFTAGCLLMDIRLPDMDGFMLLKTLRSKRVSLPIVLMTGHEDLAIKARSPRVGAFAVLDKPVSEADLLDTIERALRHSPCATAA